MVTVTVIVCSRLGEQRRQTTKAGDKKLRSWGDLGKGIQKFCKDTFGGAVQQDYNLTFVNLHSRPHAGPQDDHCDLTSQGRFAWGE